LGLLRVVLESIDIYLGLCWGINCLFRVCLRFGMVRLIGITVKGFSLRLERLQITENISKRVQETQAMQAI
jgi:hypothetical protein